MPNRACFVCLEGPDNLEGPREDPNLAIVPAEKQIIGSGTDTAEVIALAVLASATTMHDETSN